MEIVVGKVVNTFGIKGELKVVSSFERSNDVFKKNNVLIINNKSYCITGVRFHKNNYLVELDNIKDINEIEYLIGYDVYINRDDLILGDNEYLIRELIGYRVISNNIDYGVITDYDDNRVNPLIRINNIIVPLNGYYDKIDKVNKVIYLKDISGLVL